MSGSSNYYSKFIFTATGLPQVLSQFKAAAAQIDAQAATMGKMNFAGLGAALPILRNIDNSLMLMGQHLNLFSSQSAKLGQVFTPMSAGATKASAATKSVATSMTQLQAVSGRVSSSTAKVTSSMSAMGTAGKAALGGIVSAGERAIATMSALSAATMSVGQSMARMGVLASIPMAGMRGLSGAITGSLLASSAGMLLNPFNAAPLAAGYGLYTQGNVGKAASEAAAKSWQPGMSQKDIDAIKQAVMSNSRSAAGQSIYSPTDIAKMWAEYAGMGGDVSAGKITDSLSKVFTNYAQAINVPDIGTALNTLVSQNLVWNGQEKAFNEDTLRKTSDMMAMVVAQTKLKGENLNDLLKDVSPVAKSYGLSQEETYAMTGGLAQLGLNPQQAGMALRRILLRGTPNVSALEKQEAYNQGITNEKGNIIDAETGKEISLSYVNQALDQLNLTWEDINPEKNTNGIVGVFQDIASKMKEAGMSPEQQQAWMKTVYGLQGVTPAQMLTQNPEYLLDLYEKIKKSSGAAKSMSEIMTDNMIDQLKMLGSAVKGSAMDIGAYFEPSVVKLTKFLKDSALPGLNALGSALAAGDWEGAADIVGSAIDFLGGKFEDAGPVLTDWINNGIDGLDEFSQRFADFTSGGGVSDLFGGLGEWAQNIWDGIDWSQVDAITANLSTAFNNAWDQSMAWFQTQIDGINWDSVGARLGTALETGGAWLLNIADKIPWASLTTAATNALTGIVATINWSSAISTAINTGSSIGAALYTGIAGSNIGTLFQSWAGQFLNSMVGAINTVSGSLAALAMQMGAMPSTVGSAVTALQQLPAAVGTAVETARNTDNIAPTLEKTVASLDSFGDMTVTGKVASYLKEKAQNLWDTYFGEQSASSPIAAPEFTSNFQEGLPSLEQIKSKYPYLNKESSSRMSSMFDVLRTNQEAEGFYVTKEEADRTGKTANMCIQASEKALDALKAAGFGSYAALITNPSLAPGDEGHARVAIDPTGNFAPDTTFAVNTTPHTGGGGTDDFEGTFKEEMSSLVNPGRLEWDFYKNPVTGDDPRQLSGNPDFSFTPDLVNRLAQTFTAGLKDAYTQSSIKKDQPFYYGTMNGGEIDPGKVYSTDTASLYLSKEERERLKFNPGSPIAGVGGTEEKSYPGIASSTPVGQAAVNAAYAATQTGTQGVYEVPHADGSGGDSDSLSSKVSKSLSDASDIISKVNDDAANYINQPRESYPAKDRFLEDPYGTMKNWVLGQGWNKPLDPVKMSTPGEVSSSIVTAEQKKVADQNQKTGESTVKALNEQTPATTAQTSATASLTGATSGLTGSLESFASLINANDYAGIAAKLEKEYGVSGKDAEYFKDIDKILVDKTDIDAAIKGFTLAGKLPWAPPEVAKAIEETAENTSRLKDVFKESMSLRDRMLGEVQKNFDASLAERAGIETTLPSGVQPGPGTGKGGYSGYGGAVRIGLDENGRETAVIGSVRQRSWEEEGKTWATILSEVAKNALAGGNSIFPANGTQPLASESRSAFGPSPDILNGGIFSTGWDKFPPITPTVDTTNVDNFKETLAEGGQLPISSDTSLADTSLTEFQTRAGLPTKSNHWIYVDDSMVKNAIAFNKQPTWSTHTIYINEVSRKLANSLTSANYGDPIPSGIPKSQGGLNDSYPAFDEGGYTGSYKGQATVHPHELILNAAQQRGVADSIGGSSGRSVTVHIDARGSIGTDWNEVIAKIKSALQDESYR
jgi:TP901 family phage tail tape measure protein